MAVLVCYIKEKLLTDRILDHRTLKNPIILYTLAFILSLYFIFFGWQKKSPID